MAYTRRLANLATWQLSEAAARAHRILREYLDGENANGYEYRVLAALGDLGQISQVDLGRATGLDRSDITHTVRKLEARRFVSRESDPRDARRSLVELTEAGRRMLVRLDKVIQLVQDEVFMPITDAEITVLLGLLRRLS